MNQPFQLLGTTLSTVGSIDLPAGSYLLWANMQLGNLGAGGGLQCFVGNGVQFYGPEFLGSQFPMFLGHITLPSAGTATFQCQGLVPGSNYPGQSAAITAIKVGTLTIVP